MKTLALIVGLMLLASAAKATTYPTQPVTPAQSSGTFCTPGAISISNSAGTAIITGAAFASGISVWNLDASATLYCLPDDPNVATSGAHQGFQIVPGPTPLSILLRPGQSFYCITGGAAPTNAQACWGH